MDLGEMGWEGVDWMHLAQDRGQWALVNSNELSGSVKRGELLDYRQIYSLFTSCLVSLMRLTQAYFKQHKHSKF
jgi:hypothetical protein